MRRQRDRTFDHLIAEAMAQDFSGWDFSWLRSRWFEADPPWDYEETVREAIRGAGSLLDMGTGGGEFLASLAPLPPHTVATESYEPNIAVAAERLLPIGVQVVTFDDDHALPMAGEQFDLIINRHESYAAQELVRLLKPGGRFVTQQVGNRDCLELNRFLGAPPDAATPSWSLPQEMRNLEAAGLTVKSALEAQPLTQFYDIGAVVFFLKVISWQIPDFAPQKYQEGLLAMHSHIEEHGAFTATAHRCLIEACKPAS